MKNEVNTYHSQDDSDLKTMMAREYDLWTLPEETTWPSSDDGFTWELRRKQRSVTHNRHDYRAVQRYWAGLRAEQNWRLEQPMMLTAKYYVKRVVI